MKKKESDVSLSHFNNLTQIFISPVRWYKMHVCKNNYSASEIKIEISHSRIMHSVSLILSLTSSVR